MIRVVLYAVFCSSVLMVMLSFACGDDDSPDAVPTSTLPSSTEPAPTSIPSPSPGAVSCEQWPDASGAIDNERIRLTLPDDDFAAMSVPGGNIGICYRPSNPLMRIDPTTGQEVSRTVNDQTAGALFDRLIVGLESHLILYRHRLRSIALRGYKCRAV
jgi:hypothetical protein